MIRNAKDVRLDAQPGTLPDVSGALLDWFQQMTFTLITKTNVNFELVEVEVPMQAMGVRQPMKSQEVWLKPEGQRDWKWETIHAQPGLVLSPDDVVVFAGTRYRVKDKTDWKEYGYVQYDIAEDVTS